MDKLKIDKRIIIIVVLVIGTIIFHVATNRTKNSSNSLQYVFDESKYSRKNQKYYEDKSKYMAMYSSFLYEVSDDVNIEDINTDDLLNWINLIVAGNVSNICFEEEIYNDYLYEYFGILDYIVVGDTDFYTYKDGKICFENDNINELSIPTVLNYNVTNNRIIVTVADEVLKYTLTYREDTGVLLNISRQPLND